MNGLIEKKFIEALEKRKREYADTTLNRPTDPTEFGYGKASGVYQGFCLAGQLFLDIIGEEDDRT